MVAVAFSFSTVRSYTCFMYSLDIILTGQNKFAYEIDDNFRNNPLVHGLRTPNEAFFHQNPKLLGLGRQFGQINFVAFGVFSADLSPSILVLQYTVSPLSMFSINHPLFL